MAEIVAAGYTNLRTVGPVTDWYVELQEPDGTPVLRVDEADARCTITDDVPTQTVTFEVTLAGDDGDLGVLPTTIDRAVAFDAAAAGNAMTGVETFAEFTFGATTDECTFRLRVQVPQQA